MRWFSTMLRCIIVMLLIASFCTLGIQAEDNREERTELNGVLGVMAPVNGGGIKALMVQDSNQYGTDPNNKNHYGSVVEVVKKVYDNSDSSQPSSTQTLSIVAPGSPGHEGISYEQRNQNPTFYKGTILGALAYNRGRFYHNEPGTESSHGSYLQLHNNNHKSKRSYRSVPSENRDQQVHTTNNKLDLSWLFPSIIRKLISFFTRNSSPYKLTGDKFDLFTYSLIVLFTYYFY